MVILSSLQSHCSVILNLRGGLVCQGYFFLFSSRLVSSRLFSPIISSLFPFFPLSSFIPTVLSQLLALLYAVLWLILHPRDERDPGLWWYACSVLLPLPGTAPTRAHLPALPPEVECFFLAPFLQVLLVFFSALTC